MLLQWHSIPVFLNDWTINAILVRPIKNGKEETIVEAFKNLLAYLTEKGFKTKLNIMDNVVSKLVQVLLEE